MELETALRLLLADGSLQLSSPATWGVTWPRPFRQQREIVTRRSAAARRGLHQELSRKGFTPRLIASRTRRGVPSSERPRAGLNSAASHAITTRPRLRVSPRCAVAPTGRLLTIAAGGDVNGLENRERPGSASPSPGSSRNTGPRQTRGRAGCLEALLTGTDARD